MGKTDDDSKRIELTGEKVQLTGRIDSGVDRAAKKKLGGLGGQRGIAGGMGGIVEALLIGWVRETVAVNDGTASGSASLNFRNKSLTSGADWIKILESLARDYPDPEQFREKVILSLAKHSDQRLIGGNAMHHKESLRGDAGLLSQARRADESKTKTRPKGGGGKPHPIKDVG